MAWNKLPKGFNNGPKYAKMDRFDEEAEREGSARKFFKTNELNPLLGRRIAKINQTLDGRRKTAECKATRSLVADTANAYRSHLAGVC